MNENNKLKNKYIKYVGIVLVIVVIIFTVKSYIGGTSVSILVGSSESAYTIEDTMSDEKIAVKAKTVSLKGDQINYSAKDKAIIIYKNDKDSSTQMVKIDYISNDNDTEVIPLEKCANNPKNNNELSCINKKSNYIIDKKQRLLMQFN